MSEHLEDETTSRMVTAVEGPAARDGELWINEVRSFGGHRAVASYRTASRPGPRRGPGLLVQRGAEIS